MRGRGLAGSRSVPAGQSSKEGAILKLCDSLNRWVSKYTPDGVA